LDYSPIDNDGIPGENDDPDSDSKDPKWVVSDAPLVELVYGDTNASKAVDIDNAVHLINCIFTGGPEPNLCHS
jgi:hypothetical protein